GLVEDRQSASLQEIRWEPRGMWVDRQVAVGAWNFLAGLMKRSADIANNARYSENSKPQMKLYETYAHVARQPS
ncbi:MAG: hypothetical protein RSB42_13870, partial [Comamonas sp.]